MNFRRCPKCKSKCDYGSIECGNCGIIFDKYISNRDSEFCTQLQSLSDSSLIVIQQNLSILAGKYPDLSTSCNEIVSLLKQGVEKLKTKEFDESIRIFRVLGSKYPDILIRANKYIKIAEERKVKQAAEGSNEHAAPRMNKIPNDHNKNKTPHSSHSSTHTSPKNEAKIGLFACLFETSFSSKAFISTRLMKIIYTLNFIFITLGSVGFLISGVQMLTNDFERDNIQGFLNIIGAPIGFVFFLILARLSAEFIIVIFKIYDNLEIIANKEW